MSEVEKQPKIRHESFEFFTLKGLRRFKPSELVISEVMAILSDLKWLAEELELGRVRA